jgi:hemolysin III
MNSIEVKKEIANSATHGLGLLLFLVGVPIILSMSVLTNQIVTISSVAVYSFCLMMVYLSSTLYHSFGHPLTKRVLRTFDHVSIYFLIAGSYTPFILLYFNHTKGHYVLFFLWLLVLLGTVFKIFFTGKWDMISTAIYLAMGWTIIFFGKELLSSVPSPVLIWLFVGGAFYTIGIVFYVWKGFVYHHAIWHLFVLGGSVGHFMAVLKAIYISLHH